MIAAYVLADRPLERLVESLHPNPSEADWDKIRSLSYARRRKGGPDKDGLIRTAEQLATAVYGGVVGQGAPPPDVSPVEQALAFRITEGREAEVPDETIYDEMRHVRLTKQELTWGRVSTLRESSAEVPRELSQLIGHFRILLCMEDAKDNRLIETWDRLVLLLIASPREGWEPEFEEITRREIERLAVPAEEQERRG